MFVLWCLAVLMYIVIGCRISETIFKDDTLNIIIILIWPIFAAVLFAKRFGSDFEQLCDILFVKKSPDYEEETEENSEIIGDDTADKEKKWCEDCAFKYDCDEKEIFLKSDKEKCEWYA